MTSSLRQFDWQRAVRLAPSPSPYRRFPPVSSITRVQQSANHALYVLREHLAHLPLRSNISRRPLSTWLHYPCPPTFLLCHSAITSAMSATSNASTKKRKHGAPKFYAVKVGRRPGVYHSWEDCKAQVDGVQSTYKSFSTLSEAEAFVRGSVASSSNKSGKAPKFYGVAVGRTPGVYTDYSRVQAQVNGYPGAKQKGFATHEEAQAYVTGFTRDTSAPISLRGDLSETSSLVAGKGLKSGEGQQKKQKKNDGSAAPVNGDVKWELGTGPLPPGAEDGFDPTIKLDPETGTIRLKTKQELSATRMQPTGDFSGPINVYTDGSSLGNGKLGAVGGVGVYFGPQDPRNVSEALRGEKQTNQRAELTAVARALDHVPIDRDVLIHTDSKYSIQCLTDWFIKWEKNGWKSSTGRPVENKDLVEPILVRIRERDACRAKTSFKWIKGHANDPGNVAADCLAVQGSRTSTPTLRNAPQTSSTLNGTPGFESLKADPAASSDIDAFLSKDAQDAAEFEDIFADLAAQQSTQNINNVSTVPQPVTAVTQLAKAGAREGQEQLNKVINGA